MKLRSFLSFAAGLAVGAALTVAFIAGPPRVKAAPVQTAAHYADIDGGSAASAIKRLSSEGILVASPDKKFHGDQVVTRYEMAVVLDRFVRYIEKGRKPLHVTSTSVTDSQVSAPVGHWAHAAQIALVRGRFVPVDSPLMQPPGTKPVTATQFSDALASTVARISDRSLPPTPNADDPDDYKN
jgi:hypothetical protein